jgi:hypothetical protein
MLKRRLKQAGFCRFTIRLTHSGRAASTNILENDGTLDLEALNEWLATPPAGPQNSLTAAVRSFCSRTWRGFAIIAEEILHAATYTKPNIIS